MKNSTKETLIALVIITAVSLFVGYFTSYGFGFSLWFGTVASVGTMDYFTRRRQRKLLPKMADIEAEMRSHALQFEELARNDSRLAPEAAQMAANAQRFASIHSEARARLT